MTSRRRRRYLVILRCKLVEALLDDMIPVEVLDEHDDVQAQSEDDRVDLNVRWSAQTPIDSGIILTGVTLACLRVERKSIIF